MEYVTESLVQSVFQELVRGPLELFNSHALTRAQAQDYLRNTQIRQTLQPLANKLLAQWGSQETANAELQQVLLELPTKILLASQDMERVISSIFWGSSRWISVDWTFRT